MSGGACGGTATPATPERGEGTKRQRRHTSIRLFLPCFLILAVAACGPLPRPFKAENGQGVESPFQAIRDSVGVVVAPVRDAPPAVAGPLADMLVEKLAGKGIPATTSSALKEAYLLEGGAAAPGMDGNVAIDWSLTDERGAVVRAFSTRHEMAPPAWQAGEEAALAVVAGRVAESVALALQGPAVVAQPVTKKPPPGVAVVAVEGAPGDGNTALKTAFEAVLKRAGLPLAADPATAVIRIYGKVTAAPAEGGTDALTIAWSLRDSQDVEIGTLTQSNKVPQGRLDTTWGSLAYDVTTAVIGSVVEVLKVIDDADDIRRR